MATGTTYASITEKRLFGTADFRDRLLGHLRGLVQESYEKSFRGGCVYDAALSLVSGGNDKVTISGTSEATDGQGHLLDVATSGYASGLQFQNTAAVEYEVGLHYAEVPNGVQVNPRTGLPEFVGYDEAIGESGTPDLVTDNGNGTITFRVNSVTEAGVSNAGRKVKVWKIVPGSNATTEAVAVEELTVSWTGSNNEITTAAAFGQDTVSTTAADYTVVLMGPTIKRNTTLYDVDGYAFLGKVTGGGAGSPPSGYDITDQDVIDMSLSDLADITSRNATTDRLKIDVKSYTGDVDDPQIQVRNPSGTPVFTVDGNGNVVIEGTTTQEDFVQVNASETITDNLTAGDDGATDSHKIKGTWWHTNNAETANYFKVDGATGHVGIGKTHDATWEVDIAEDLRVNGIFRIEGSFPTFQIRENDVAVDAGGLWRLIDSGGDIYFQENTAAGGDFGTVSSWLRANRALGAFGFSKHVYPSGDDLYDLGSSSYQWRNLYIDGFATIDTLYISNAAGEGVATAIVPTTNDAYTLGSSSYRWLYMYGSILDIQRANDSAVTLTANFDHTVTTVDDLPLLNVNFEVNTAATVLDGFGGYNRYQIEGNTVSYTRWSRRDADTTADVIWYLYSGSAHTPQLKLKYDGGIDTRTILPYANNTYDLGSASYQWANLYVTTLNLGSDFLPAADDSYDLGSASLQWRNLYIDGTAYIDTLSLSTTGGEGVITSINPTNNQSYDLGTGSYRWRFIYCRYIDSYVYTDTTAAQVFWWSHYAPTVTNQLLKLGTYEAATDGTVADNFGWYVDYNIQYNTVARMEVIRADADDTAHIYWSLWTGSAYEYQLALWYNGGMSTRTIWPWGDDTYDLGSSSLQWHDLWLDGIAYLDTIRLSNAAGEGVDTHFVPTTDDAYNLGSTSYRWANIVTAQQYADFTSNSASVSLGSYYRRTTTLTADTLRIFNYVAETSATMADGFGGTIAYYLDGGTLARVAQMEYVRAGADDQCDITWYLNDETDTMAAVLGIKYNHQVRTRHVIPYSDDSWDLGSATREWQNLYIDGTAYVDTLSLSSAAGEGVVGHLVPTATNTYDLGSDSYRWRLLYGVRLDIERISDNTANQISIFRRKATTVTDQTLVVNSYTANTDATAADGFGGKFYYYNLGNIVYVQSWKRRGADDQVDVGWFLRDGADAYVEQLSIKYDGGIDTRTILPFATNTYDLGSGSYRWYDCYFNSVNAKNTWNVADAAPCLQLERNTTTITNVSLRTAVFNATTDATAADWFGGYNLFQIQGNQVAYYEWSRRDADTTADFWMGLWTGSAWDAKIGMYYDGGIGTKDITPFTTETYDLGSNSYRWNTFYIKYIDGFRYSDTVDQRCFSFNHNAITVTSDGLLVGNFNASTDATAADGFGGYYRYYIQGNNVGWFKWSRRDADDTADMVWYSWNGSTTVTNMVLYYEGRLGSRDHTPFTDDQYDLGSSSLQWKDLYLDGVAYVDELVLSAASNEGVGNHLVPASNSTWTLGNTNYYWSYLYANRILSSYTNNTETNYNVRLERWTTTGTNQAWTVGEFDARSTQSIVNGFGGLFTYKIQNVIAAEHAWVRRGASDQCDLYWYLNDAGDTMTWQLKLKYDGGIDTRTILPAANETYNLGNGTTNRWNIIYNTYINTIQTSATAVAAAFKFIHNGDTETNDELLIGEFIADTEGTQADGFGGYLAYKSETVEVARDQWTRNGADDQYNFSKWIHNGTSLTQRMQFHYAGATYLYDENGTQIFGTLSNRIFLGATASAPAGSFATDSKQVIFGNGTTAANRTYLTYTGQDDQDHFLSVNAYYDTAGNWRSWQSSVWPMQIEINPSGSSADFWFRYSTGTASDGDTFTWSSILRLSDVVIGLYKDADPYTGNTISLGTATLYYLNIYTNNLYWKTTHTTFDNYDDLALIDEYGPGPDAKTKAMVKAGETRLIQHTQSNFPWPMLGPRDPDAQNWFVDLGDSFSFILGAIKQLHRKHKEEVRTLAERLDMLEAKLEAALQ